MGKKKSKRIKKYFKLFKQLPVTQRASLNEFKINDMAELFKEYGFIISIKEEER